MSTNLKADNFCQYNSAAAVLPYMLAPFSNVPMFGIGETGVPVSLGTTGAAPANLVDIESTLLNYNQIQSQCIQPKSYITGPDPTPDPKLNIQGQAKDSRDIQLANDAQYPRNTQEKFSTVKDTKMSAVPREVDANTFLMSDSTRRKGVGKDLSMQDWQAGFSGNLVNLFTYPQKLTWIMGRYALERGGTDSAQIIKDTWNFKEGPLNQITNKRQELTCKKTRQPYSTQNSIFGFPVQQNKIVDFKESVPFDALDVISSGKASELFEQDPTRTYNYRAAYQNGGCNPTSQVPQNECGKYNALESMPMSTPLDATWPF